MDLIQKDYYRKLQIVILTWKIYLYSSFPPSSFLSLLPLFSLYLTLNANAKEIVTLWPNLTKIVTLNAHA